MTDRGWPKRCIACDSEPRRGPRLSNGSDLLCCPRCGLAWWEWPEFEPADLYDESYFQSAGAARGYNDYASLEPGLRRTARARLRRIAALHGQAIGAGSPRPRLLDVGCGTGVFLDEAARTGWDAEGLEVSEYAAAAARRRGLHVQTGAIETAQLPPAAYDCITFWDSFEHLRDPVGALRAAAAGLRAGGVVAISTGDITSLCARISGRHWHLLNLPEHLFFFSPQSLGRLLNRAGLRVARVMREVYWTPFAYVRERFAKSFGWAPPAPSCVLDELIVPATLFDVLGVYAIRRAGSS